MTGFNLITNFDPEEIEILLMNYIIIGAGPGGYELAALLARQKHNVTLIERAELGGTCLNRGCIPTKVMAHAAALARDARNAAAFGIEVTPPLVNFDVLCSKRSAIVDTLRSGVEMLLAGVNIVKGEAKFTGPHSVEVDGVEYTADKIVIATGSSSATLPIPGSSHAVTSDVLLILDKVPESLAIIGGGVIGMEFASIFSTLGAKVTVIEYFKEILPQFDKDIAKRLRQAMAAEGVTFVTGAQVTAIEEVSGNGNPVTFNVLYTSGTKSGEVEAGVVAMAVGRRPNLPQGLDIAGITTEHGRIIVNPETFLTSNPDVYAIGDVNGICMLAHAASAQARVVAGEQVNMSVIPSVVFTYPELAIVGMTEQQCKDAGINYRAAKIPFRGNGKAVTIGETDGMVKLIADADSGNVLGCQIMGPHAADLIEEVAVVIANKLTVKAITSTIHPHPTLCEAVAMAAANL